MRNMNSPGSKASSPTFKNLKSKHRQSPVEIKEKMRKNYKDKVQNCRNILMNRFRGSDTETDLRETLTDIYKSMFNLSDEHLLYGEEQELLEDIKSELVQEELQWWLQEYEKSQMENIDWSSMEQDNNVICPVCQKTNFSLQNTILSCSHCKSNIKTTKSLLDIRNSVISCIDRHNAACNSEVQFVTVSEVNEAHIYLICESCVEMQVVV